MARSGADVVAEDQDVNVGPCEAAGALDHGVVDGVEECGGEVGVIVEIDEELLLAAQIPAGLEERAAAGAGRAGADGVSAAVPGGDVAADGGPAVGGEDVGPGVVGDVAGRPGIAERVHHPLEVVKAGGDGADAPLVVVVEVGDAGEVGGEVPRLAGAADADVAGLEAEVLGDIVLAGAAAELVVEAGREAEGLRDAIRPLPAERGEHAFSRGHGHRTVASIG